MPILYKLIGIKLQGSIVKLPAPTPTGETHVQYMVVEVGIEGDTSGKFLHKSESIKVFGKGTDTIDQGEAKLRAKASEYFTTNFPQPV